MNYQIVATLGPRSDTESAWQAMLAAGVTGLRLNPPTCPWYNCASGSIGYAPFLLRGIRDRR